MKLPYLHGSPLLKYERALAKLASNFSGLEEIIVDESELPSEIIPKTVMQSMQAPLAEQESVLRELIARLPLFEYHAAAGGEVWNPLAESLQDFRARHRRKGKVTLWRDWGQFPTAAEVEQWLDRWLDS